MQSFAKSVWEYFANNAADAKEHVFSTKTHLAFSVAKTTHLIK